MEFYFSTSRDEDRILAFGPASKRKNSVFEGYAGVVWQGGVKTKYCEALSVKSIYSSNKCVK